MAKFEGIHWADRQLRYLLTDKSVAVLPEDAPIAACSRSTNYAIFLAFEGIRFFCRKNPAGRLEVVFLNWDRNLERFRRGMAFNLAADQTALVPTREELEDLIVRRYFGDPAMRPFLEEMAAMKAQGYLRPFTVDEEQSIGVTFPNQPAIRMLANRYDRYMGEPFEGVVVPNLVRAVGLNGTGCLKLGINYVVSIKAIDAARRVHPGAASALFLDDRTHLPIEERHLTEWDSSCCLFAFSDGTVVKIPESNLILPSVTIQGITAILRRRGVKVEERDLTYGELVRRTKANEVVALGSVGTAGILNRCAGLLLTDGEGAPTGWHRPLVAHPLYAELAAARKTYWDIYMGTAEPTPEMKLFRYEI
jgi:branched-chain amino acid aminotransferase